MKYYVNVYGTVDSVYLRAYGSFGDAIKDEDNVLIDQSWSLEETNFTLLKNMGDKVEFIKTMAMALLTHTMEDKDFVLNHFEVILRFADEVKEELDEKSGKKLKFLQYSASFLNEQKIYKNVIECVESLPYYDYDKNNYEDAFNHVFLKFPFVSNDMGHFFDYANKEELLKNVLDIYIPTSVTELKEKRYFDFDKGQTLEDFYRNVDRYSDELTQFKIELARILKDE